MPDQPPKRLHVGPYEYRIVVDPDRLPADLFGQCDKGRHVIALHPEQSPTRLRSTLLHEILHALCDVTGVDDDKAEEHIATVIAPALLAVLRDNPKLVTWLTTNPA